MTKLDWDEIRSNRLSNERPDDWPRDIEAISLEGLTLFGIHRGTGEIYWDGEKLITEKRWGTTERRIAVAGLIIGAIGVAATVAQAVAAYLPHC